MSHPRGLRHKRGFTLIELLVVVAIIALLAAILFPVFARAREKARAAACQSNLKQIGLAFEQYKQDYDSRFPHGHDASIDVSTIPNGQVNDRDANNWARAQMSPSDTSAPVLWPGKLEPYLKSRQIFSCPSAKRRINVPGEGVFTVAIGWNSTDSWSGAFNASYGYNYYFLGGGVFNAPGCSSTCCRGCQYSDFPSTASCQNCGVAVKDTQVETPAATFLLVDNSVSFRGTGSGGVPPAFAQYDLGDAAGEAQTNAAGGWDSGDSFDPLHTGGMNVLFTDGHVKWMNKDAFLYRPGSSGGNVCSSTYWTSTDAKFLWNLQ